MATQNPLLPIGQYVQYNATTQAPNTAVPSPDEQGLGQIRQAFTQGDGAYYQVVWNSGSSSPKTALYHQDQLNPLTQQAAQQVMSQMAAGTYQPPQQTVGSNYTQPNIPIQAAPPANQQPGMETL